MIGKHRCVSALLAVCCAFSVANLCRADYIGHFPTLGEPLPFQVTRIHDDGTLTNIDYGSSIPASVQMDIETYGEEAAVTPDLQKVYQFVNTLGFSNYIIASDANTGQYLPNESIALGFGPAGAYVDQARQPLITKSNELFVLSGIFPSSPAPNASEIKHIDLTTKSFIESIDPPTPQKIDDIAFRALGAPLGLGDQLYYSTPSGIYVEQRTNPLSEAFGSLPSFFPPLVSGVDGNIAIGPDNRLYVRNFANGDVERYSLTGQFIDTLISHSSFPNMGTIQFGVDGNLHVYQVVNNPSMPAAISNILTFSPLTGSLLWTAPNTLIYPGRVTFVPVPEPTTVMLVSLMIIGVGFCGRSKRGRLEN